MADAIVAVSDGVADELAQHTGLQRQQIVTIHNAGREPVDAGQGRRAGAASVVRARASRR